jgi:hypothetical protein
MSEDPEAQPDAAAYGMDSDAILVGAYVLKCDAAELRRYVALDIITALNPWTDKSIQQAKQIEAFLLGKGPKVVE